MYQNRNSGSLQNTRGTSQYNLEQHGKPSVQVNSNFRHTWVVLMPGTPEHPGTSLGQPGTLRNTPEQPG